MRSYYSCSECDSPPPVKKPKMASVVVEQSGGPSSNKVLIDQVADVESPFEEVRILC